MYPTQTRQGYNSVPPAGNPRRTEGWALTEAARLMASCQHEPVDRKALLDTVRRNWRLWTIFQASVVDDDCPLPDEIRSNILSLSNFIDKHTLGVLADPKPAKLDILISINREIAAGLLTPVASDLGGSTAGSPPMAGGGTSAINQSA